MTHFDQDGIQNLLQEAEKLGLIDVENTINCSNCRVVFPKEYEKCPQCHTIEITETW